MENRNWMRRSHSRLAVVLVPIFYFLFSACLYAQNAKKEKVDMLVAGGTDITKNGERLNIAEGRVAGNGDTPVAVGSGADIPAESAAPQHVNAGQKNPPVGLST